MNNAILLMKYDLRQNKHYIQLNYVFILTTVKSNFCGTFNFVYFVGKENPRNLISVKLFISYTFVIFHWKSTKLNAHPFVTNLKSMKFYNHENIWF